MKSGVFARSASTAVAALLALATLVIAPPTAHAAGGRVYPVPTSDAGLGRIVTAPDGNMWFIERDANKLGRITPSGQISEWPLPTSSTYSVTEDVDVAQDGTVWVVYDTGAHAAAVNGSGARLGTYSLFDNPYGGEVRVDRGGIPWITMNYDESGVARIVGDSVSWPQNAPECDDVLGRGSDGTMWCAHDAGLVRIAPGASGGATYPLGLQGAERPSSLAAGPAGSIWFTSFYSGAWGIGTGDGEVGYVDQDSGDVVFWRTGSRTAPTSLVAGPDGSMWFTMEAGGAKGIGHINKQGVGALSAVGAYSPTAMTFAHDGSVWFTDETNNSIVHVDTAQLAASNVDPGDGVTMLRGLTAPTPSISGRVAVGGTLSVRVGSWTAGTRLTYQWYADGKAIAGATKSTLVPTAAQLGKQISVRVKGAKSGYATVVRSSGSVKVGRGVLVAHRPSISGRVRVGSTLRVKVGSWTRGAKLTYQWYANGKKVAHATKSTFVPTAAHLGRKVSVSVRGAKAGYTTVVRSSGSVKVGRGVLVAHRPSISGRVRVGSTLRVKVGSWTRGAKLTYQWYANGKKVAHATKSRLRLTMHLHGKKIAVRVTGKKRGFATAARISKQTKRIA